MYDFILGRCEIINGM